jgi:dUTP pyrophosphatase
MKLYWAKVKENAILPQKRDEDAGYDLYACFDEDYLEIAPHETKLVPLGVASAFEPGYVILLKERGSSGTKGLAQRAGVIDSGYRGEYMCPITNTNTKPVRIVKQDVLKGWDEDYASQFLIYPYEKAVCQGLLLVCPNVENEEISYDDLKAIASLRQEGRLGSSGK